MLLWAKAAGRCSNPACRRPLALDSTIGHAAHIFARSPRGPRGHGGLTPNQRSSPANLILLCPQCHTEVDEHPGRYPAGILLAWKERHESWVASVTAAAPPEAPSTTILQDPDSRVDRVELAPHLLLTGQGDAGWPEAAEQDRVALEALLAATPAERRRFQVFSMGRIPLAVNLGFVLGDRFPADIRHYDRDRCSWSWSPDPAPPGDLAYSLTARSSGEVNIVVSLSASIDPVTVPQHRTAIDIGVPSPSVRWLRHPDQLTALRALYERAFADARLLAAGRIHLYYAGPTAAAVEFGRAYNPRMNPPLELYEFALSSRPRYEAVLLLNQPRA